jgi:hypothetical protein
MQMVSAINLFYETGNSEAVDSIIGSSIKKDLWQAVYRKLMTDPSRYDRIRKIFRSLNDLESGKPKNVFEIIFGSFEIEGETR